MGTRLAKPPPAGRPLAQGKPGRNPLYSRPFPAITPQSYLPGGAGVGPYGNYSPGKQRRGFPVIGPNSYLPPMGSMEPPIMNFSGPNMLPAPVPYQPMPPMVPSLPPMGYPQPGAMSMMVPPPPPPCDPGYRPCVRRRPVRVCRRRGRRSRRRRPVLQIIDSSSCSSLSSYSTISSCSRRHRSRTRSRRRAVTPRQQQQQQPIIVLPVQCQQPQGNPTSSVQYQQSQPQQIFLPPLQFSQQGQCQSQQLALPSIPIQQHQQLALSPISIQPQGVPIRLSSSNLIHNTNANSMVIPSGQPMLQPSISLPQITNIGQPQQIHSGAIQYVQAAPPPPSSSSSQLQYISSEPRSTIAPQRILVNSTNKRQSPKVKPIPRSASVRDVPQNDLKFGRRPFDWYNSDRTNNIINEKVQVGQRGSSVAQ